MDIFGQIYCLDQGNALGRYITHYRSQYFSPTGYMGYDWQLKDGADKLIHAKLQSLILEISADEDTPEEVSNIIRVTLPDAARKIYDDLEEEMFAELDNGEIVTAVSAGAMTSKISQVADGG